VLGISFDTPVDNNLFRDEHNFPFQLLSDPDKTIGASYEVLRDADDKFADYPNRISYLIDPDGEIVKAYEVTDPGGHAVEVLADLVAAKR